MILQLIFIALQIIHCRANQEFTLCSMSGTELRGNATICPGNSGIFECKTTNTDILVWRVNDTTISIPEDHRVDDGPVIVSENVAYLVKLNLKNGNIGNRTSLLRVPPSLNNVSVTIECIGGNTMNTCSREINFIGTDYIAYPINQSMFRNRNGTIDFSWRHNVKEMVSHYSVVLKTERHMFNFTSIKTSIIIPEIPSGMRSASLSAFSVCGGESASVPFKDDVVESGSTTIRSAPVMILAYLMILCYATRELIIIA